METAHFNAVAGRDEWGPQKDRPGVRHLFVIGWPAARGEGVRRLAAALTGRPIPAEEPQLVTRGALMRDGSASPVPVRAYANPDMEAVRAAITDAELVQDIGRGRGLNRTEANPLDVWVFAGDVVLPLPLDSRSRWEDVAPGPMARMAARGVSLASPSDAARAYPDLFPTTGAAKKALQRDKAGQEHGDIPLWSPPIGVCPRVRLVRVRYRPNQPKAKTRTAWAHPDHLPSLRAWLEAVTGAELIQFEPGELPPPPAPLPPSPSAAPPEPAVMPEPCAPPLAPPTVHAGLHPSALDMRRVGPGAARPLAVPGGLAIHLPANARRGRAAWIVDMLAHPRGLPPVTPNPSKGPIDAAPHA